MSRHESIGFAHREIQLGYGIINHPEGDKTSERALQVLWDEAFEAGRAAGYARGYATGFDDGYDRGHEDGYKEGVRDGADATIAAYGI